MTLAELRAQLQQFAAGEIDLEVLHRALAPVLAADPLDVEQSSDAPWAEETADDTRLFWRLVYLLEVADDVDVLRGHAARILRCLDDTGDSALTYELLPLLFDQERLRVIVAKHAAGVISRTGFLNVVANSGYAPHVKLWLQHAPVAALLHLADLLRAGAYRTAAATLERRPS
jgi:hypothetical protein